MADLNSTIVRGNLRVTDDENVNGNLKVGGTITGNGGTMTGSLTLSEGNNILLRPNLESYTSGIGYDTAGNECIALWAKNSVTRLRWHAGTDMSNLAPWTMMNITPDFEISKASGEAKGYIAGKEIIHSGNISSQSVNYAATAGSANSATKATQDGNGNTITTTYVAKSDKPTASTPGPIYMTFSNGILTISDEPIS